jgi:dolichol-phosphate mannosyltransferase
MTDLSIIIPAYQEAENLKVVLPRLIAVLEPMAIDHEIIIVDSDLPLDDTEAVCCEYTDTQVRFVRRREGPSFGSAVRTGIAEASGRHVLCIDGDGSHDPAIIPNLYQNRQQFDVVVASRYIEGGETKNNWVLTQMSLIVNFAFRVVFAIDCNDISNSFKLYNGDELRRLHLVCDNFDLVEEILIKLKKNKPDLTIKEIPIIFHNRLHGQTKRKLLLFIFTFAYTLIRLRFMR